MFRLRKDVIITIKEIFDNVGKRMWMDANGLTVGRGYLASS